jgi:Tfp pilus assembly protein PilV
MTQMRQGLPDSEAGFMIIEVLASAVIMLIVSAGIFGLLQATAHSSSEDRHRSEGYSVSQEDQARLRSMRLSALNALDETRAVPLNGTKFTVHSTGTFVNDLTGTTSCSAPETTADYVRITSEVTWPRMQGAEPATIESIVSPSKSLSLDPKNGTLSITARNAQGAPLPGVKLVGSGPAPFNSETNELGCALFNLPAGTYTMIPSGINLIDKDGLPPAAMPVSVTTGVSTPYTVEYDHPGTIPVSFETLLEGKLVPAKADSVFVYQTGMSTARIFSTTGLVREPTVNATPLYPFPSPYAIYAGSCAVNNPNTEGKGAAGVANVTVLPGETKLVGSAKVQIPALNLTVTNGATPIKGAKITITDRNCLDGSGKKIKRTYTTNGKGNQTANPPAPGEPAEPGLPWGVYEICASTEVAKGSFHRKTLSGSSGSVKVQSLTTPAAATIDLSKEFLTGECP